MEENFVSYGIFELMEMNNINYEIPGGKREF
jgi:hypothetical protein